MTEQYNDDLLHRILRQQTQTHTLLQSHVKLSDERHDDIKDTLQDYETRIRKGESFRARLIGWAVGAGLISAGAAEFIGSKIGL